MAFNTRDLRGSNWVTSCSVIVKNAAKPMARLLPANASYLPTRHLFLLKAKSLLAGIRVNTGCFRVYLQNNVLSPL